MLERPCEWTTEGVACGKLTTEAIELFDEPEAESEEDMHPLCEEHFKLWQSTDRLYS